MLCWQGLLAVLNLGSQRKGLNLKGKRVLVTGGAGFVGSHTADALLKAGHAVRIFDNLSPQVHQDGKSTYLAEGAEFVLGDMREQSQVNAAVKGMDVIFHLAAAVGVGQSMYQISDYTETNNLGTANLLQAILDTRSQPEKIVVASSMSIYGEGNYLCSECGEVSPSARPLSQMKDKRWETLVRTVVRLWFRRRRVKINLCSALQFMRFRKKIRKR